MDVNPFAIGPFIVSLLCLSFGFFVLFRNKKRRLNRLFFSLCFSVFIWAFGYSLMYNTKDSYPQALFWARLGYLGVVFIPVFTYHYIITFLDLKRSPLLIISVYLLGVIFLLVSRTNLFLHSGFTYFWGYYPKAGPLYIYFVLFFALIFIRVVTLLFFALKSKKPTLPAVQINRIKYVLFGFAIATTSLVDYIPNYKIEIYPWAYLSALGWLICMGWASFRYRLMDINVVITRAGIFAVVYSLVVGIPFYIGFRIKSWFIPTISMFFLATLGPLIYTKLRRRAEDRILAQQKKYQNTLIETSKGMTLIKELDKLLNLITRTMTKTVNVNHSHIYLQNTKSSSYRLKTKKSWKGEDYSVLEEIPDTNPLIKHLKEYKKILLYDELSALKDREILTKQMKNIGADIIIPCFIQDNLISLLAMGKKASGDMFTEDDLGVFQLLANQAALAIENTQFFEKEKTLLAEKSRREALADMAPGVAHQFNNRLAAIVAAADSRMALNELEDINKLDLEKLKQIIKESQKSFDIIGKEAIRGKDIANAILKKGRAKLTYTKTDLVPIIQSAVDLVKVSRTTADLEGIPEPEIILNKEENLPQLTLSESLIQDIFYNLIDNSRDAIILKAKYIKENKTTPDTTLYKGKITIKVYKKDNNVIVAVYDNGIGMDDMTKARLFVPYFTTKATALKGTGLGLWVIRSFIEDHKGKIQIESTYKKGTTFIITFPAQEEDKNEEASNY